MELPNLPTDNLYKFIALSGVLIILFFLIYPNYKLDEIKAKHIILKNESLKNEIAVKRLNTKVVEINKDIAEFNKELEGYNLKDSVIVKAISSAKSNKLQDKFDFMDRLKIQSYRDYIKFIYDYDSKINPEHVTLFDLKNRKTIIDSLSDELKVKTIDINKNADLINIEIDAEEFWMKNFIIGVINGFLFILYGFGNWYFKVQKPLDEKLKLELEQYKIEISKNTSNNTNPSNTTNPPNLTND